MRMLGTAVLSLAAGTAVCTLGLTAASATPDDDACRDQWSDLAQLHGENGNPDGPVEEINARWEAYDTQAQTKASSATASECGAAIDTFAANWDDLESFQYDLYSFDPRADLTWAEADRRHYIELNGRLHGRAPGLRRRPQAHPARPSGT